MTLTPSRPVSPPLGLQVNILTHHDPLTLPQGSPPDTVTSLQHILALPVGPSATLPPLEAHDLQASSG